jgi:hypothetical protein
MLQVVSVIAFPMFAVGPWEHLRIQAPPPRCFPPHRQCQTSVATCQIARATPESPRTKRPPPVQAPNTRARKQRRQLQYYSSQTSAKRFKPRHTESLIMNRSNVRACKCRKQNEQTSESIKYVQSSLEASSN